MHGRGTGISPRVDAIGNRHLVTAMIALYEVLYCNGPLFSISGSQRQGLDDYCVRDSNAAQLEAERSFCGYVPFQLERAGGRSNAPKLRDCGTKGPGRVGVFLRGERRACVSTQINPYPRRMVLSA